MAYPADTFETAVDLSITASNQLHTILNGDSTTEVAVEDGSKIPSVRKAYTDSLFFLSPQPWSVGEYETIYNQLRSFVEPTGITTWWFSKTATVSSPILMSTTPHEDSNWTLWNAINNSVYETQKRLAAEAGLNMVGSFLLGATVTTIDDVVFYEADGKYYGWGGTLPKVVPAGSTPATAGEVGVGAWSDKTDLMLRGQLLNGPLVQRYNSIFALRDFVSVIDFYEAGGGAGDYSLALQLAVNTGKSVNLCGLTLNIKSGVTITTPSQRIYNGKILSDDDFSSALTDDFQFKVTAPYVVFEDVIFDINGLSGGSQDFSSYITNGVSDCRGAVLAIGGHYSKINRCYFTRAKFGQCAVSFYGVDQNKYVTVSNSIFEYNYSGGVFTQSPFLSVSNCVIRKCNDAGIAFNTGGARHGTVTGCYIEDCQYGGIAFESNAHDMTVTGNTFKQTLGGSNDCSILSSSFTEGESECYNISITGNTFYCSSVAIIIQGLNHFSIKDNVFNNDSIDESTFIYFLPLYGGINNGNISGNVISGGYPFRAYTGYTGATLDAIIIKNNNIFNTQHLIFSNAMAAIGAGTGTGIVFDGNYAPSCTGPELSATAFNAKYTFKNNYLPAWSTIGGGSKGTLLNIFGIKYSGEDGQWVSNAEPTKLNWNVGDRVTNFTPAIGQPKGWVCITAGTPGTWVSDGNL